MADNDLTAQFVFTLAKPSTRTVTLSWETRDGTAIENIDYVPDSGQLVFAPGEIAKTVTIQVLQPPTEERKFFTVAITGAVNATVDETEPGQVVIMPNSVFRGKRGYKGDRGQRGFSAYEEAVNNGSFTGSYADWILFLKVSDAVNIAFKAAFGDAVPRTQQARNSDTVSVKDFGAKGDGVTDDTAAINKAVASLRDGILKFPYGQYVYNGDMLIKQKGHAPVRGSFAIMGVGAELVGNGSIVIDSCKRVMIAGLEAPTFDLRLRGCWKSLFLRPKFRDIIMGDAKGSIFSSNYWLTFDQGQYQSIITDAAATEGNNQLTWKSVQFRGDAQQGFTSTRDFFIQFNANQDAQGWKFEHCDISYYVDRMLSVASTNNEDIQVEFDTCYFDTKYPTLASRPKTRIITKNCQAANDMPNSVPLSMVPRGSHDAWRADRAANFQSYTGQNLIPNGDLYDRLTSYVGAGLPIGSDNGAVITPKSGGGMNGNYLNINQAKTTGNQVRIRPRPFPVTGRYTGTLVLRNADAGAKTLRVGVGGLFFNAVLTPDEPTVATLTTGLDMVAGTTSDIQIYTEDGTGFNVDVFFMGMYLGDNAPLFLPSQRHQQLYGSASWNPPSLASGAAPISQDVAVPGAAPGDFADASFSAPLQGLRMWASVDEANKVKVWLINNTGAAVDLPAATVRVRVERGSYAPLDASVA